jgi:hypothetical protein
MRASGLALLLLTVPALAQAPLAGAWFGQGQPFDKNAMYLLTIRPDGSFTTHHRLCRKGREINRFVAGSWALEGGTITYHVATVNGQALPRVDVFHLVSLDRRRQSTVLLKNNFPYVADRVDAAFELPSCQLVS